MRSQASAETVRAFARALSGATRGPARIYLVGGASAVMEGWRTSTIDIDVRFEPDSELLAVVPSIKERLGVNIKFASPADFLPELPDWRQRSRFLFREGTLDFFHYDFFSQALAKLERGFSQDLADVEAMLDAGLIEPALLRELLDAVWSQLPRFPAVEPAALRAAVDSLADGSGDG